MLPGLPIPGFAESPVISKNATVLPRPPLYLRRQQKDWVWSCKSAIPTLGRLRQEDRKPGQHSKFQQQDCLRKNFKKMVTRRMKQKA
jgi:hypothetical protein